MIILFFISIHTISAETNEQTKNKDEYNPGEISLQQEKIPVKDMDLEDYQKEMEVGENKIAVSDIEISEFEEEMEVGKTQNISALVLPSYAENQTITYKSTNPQVATISSTGMITAISKGTTSIQLKAGDVTKEVKLTVNIPTSSIDVNETYIVLKAGSTYHLKAQVLPKEAEQRLTYRSTNEDVLSVNDTGTIKSRKTGKASVILSNGDMQKSVTVIVNNDGKTAVDKTEDKTIDEDLIVANDGILKTLINTGDKTVSVKSPQGGRISKETLKYLFENQKTLNIIGNGYTIIIKGEDIVNYENTLSTQILFGATEDGKTFVINNYENLPGRISLVLTEEILGKGKHLYLYHNTKEKYELLNTKIDEGHLELDIAGQYLITDKKISPFKLNPIAIAIPVVCLIILIIIYIFIKKKHWFW